MHPVSATLISLSDAPNIRVDSSVLLVGRSSDCDIVVDSKKVSRKHCCIALVSSYLVIRDLGSTNGIRVNGQRREESRLTEGDEVTIANLRYRVEWDKPQRKSVAEEGNSDQELSNSSLERCDKPIALADPFGETALPVHRGVEGAESPSSPEKERSRSKDSWLDVPDDVKMSASDDDIAF